MGQQSGPVDVESLQERCRLRGCLDGFFTMSIIFLFFALTAVTVCGVMVAMELKNSIPTDEHKPGHAAPHPNKTESFAYMRPTSSELRHDSIMEFVALHYGERNSVGSNFNFDRHSLTPKQGGYYFMFIDLSVTCTYNCKAGVLRVDVGQKLTCEVQLPSDMKPVTHKCWRVTLLHQEKLITRVTVAAGDLTNWMLDVKETGVGMFLVD